MAIVIVRRHADPMLLPYAPVSRGSRWALVCIVVAGVAVRAVFFSGYHGFDDATYIQRALDLAAHGWSLPGDHVSARSGLVVPTAVLVRLLGVGPLTIHAVPFVASVLSLLLAFEMGRRFFDDRVGLLAALLLAVFPLEVIYASHLYPTTGMTFATGLALLAFLEGDRRGEARLSFAGGLVLGLSTMLHELGAVCLVFYPLYVMLVRAPRREHLAALAGFLVGAGAEPAAYAWLAGDPLYRVRIAGAAGTVSGTAVDVADEGWNAAWMLHPWLRLCTEQELGLFPALALPVVGWRLVHPRSAEQHALVVWVVAVFLWISYGTTSPFVYAPLDRLPRYLAPLVVPVVVLLASELCAWRRPVARGLVVVALLASSLLAVTLDDGRAAQAPARALAAWSAHERDCPRLAVDASLRLPLTIALGPRRVEGMGIVDARLPESPLHDAAALGPHCVAVVRRQGTARLAERQCVRRVAAFESPRTLYRRLLASPAFRRLLSLARSEYRMQDLAARVDGWAIDVYRIDPGTTDDCPERAPSGATSDRREPAARLAA